jgi:hypothetical protein
MLVNFDNSDLYCAPNALSGASVNSVRVWADTLKYVVIMSITVVAVPISASVNPTNGVFLLWDAATRFEHSAPSWLLLALCPAGRYAVHFLV